MITLTLLHPLQAVPVQSWTFDSEEIIRIGRSTNNEVVLYSAVVSRHHVEIRHNGSDWEVINLGANGTYINGKRITKILATDGTIIRLASSGPQIQIGIQTPEIKPNVSVDALKPQSTTKRKGNVQETKDTLIN